MEAVEVFADVWCPFAHVGLERLVARRAASTQPDEPLRIRAWPLELVNGAAMDPPAVAQKVAALRRNVAPDLFAAFDEASFPSTTLPALDLAAAAQREGTEVGERVGLALRRALFEEGRPIDDPRELAAIAREHGVHLRAGDRMQVLDDWEVGRRRGVVGSPHFFVGDDGYFCPSLLIRQRDSAIGVTMDDARFDRFADRCFGPKVASEPGGG